MSEEMQEVLAAIRRRHEATGQGDWHFGQPCGELCYCDHGSCYNLWAEGGADITRACAGMTEEDAVFAAWAHQDIPTLLSLVDFLMNQIHDLKEESSAYRRGVGHERERCARLVRYLGEHHPQNGAPNVSLRVGEYLCDAILAGEEVAQ